MRVLVAPDSAGGTLDPTRMASAVAAGWLAARPHDEVVPLPLSDGGEGLLAAVGAAVASSSVHELEVVGPRGLAVDARFLLLDDGRVAIVESASACGLHHLAPDERDPLRTTSWGVGQLLDAARHAGATRVLVGLGGSATVDGGAGALSALGFRLTVGDGSGLKIGGQDLPRVRGAERRWVADWSGVAVELLADVTDPLMVAPAVYGPQKGADEHAVAHLEDGLAALRRALERDLGAAPALADTPGAGAAGGLGYGLAAALGARLRPGVVAVAELVGLDEALARADVVVTGEGRLDATSTRGKVVGHVAAAAAARGVPVGLVVGQLGDDLAVEGPLAGGSVEEASPDGPGDDPAGDVRAAAERLAARWPAAGGAEG